jgi:hypothetical protein
VTWVFEPEPVDDPGELKLGGLFVRGPFRVVKKVNNSAEAPAGWNEGGVGGGVILFTRPNRPGANVRNRPVRS